MTSTLSDQTSSPGNLSPSLNKFEKLKAEKDGLAVKQEIDYFAQIG